MVEDGAVREARSCGRTSCQGSALKRLYTDEEAGYMAEQEGKARRQSTIEERIEQEFQRAVGGIPTIERMREEYRKKYADNPSLQSFIERIADEMRRRLLAGV
jgi:hypothetical protein